MRYVITVSRGRKIILKEKYVTYEKAMDALEKIKDRYAGLYKIDFRDTQPFNWGWGS